MAAANETPLVYTTLESVHEAAEGRDLLGINDGVLRSSRGSRADDRSCLRGPELAPEATCTNLHQTQGHCTFLKVVLGESASRHPARFHRRPWFSTMERRWCWVRKGEKAFYILGPLKKKITDKETGEEKSIVVGFKGLPVFGFEQTDGEPLPIGDPDIERWIESLPLLDVAKKWGLSVDVFNGETAGYLGVYRRRAGIALGVQNWSTWAHELVHAADDRNGSFKELGQHFRSETVAELGGAVLLELLGFSHEADLGGCWEYVKGYAEMEKITVVDACMKTLDRTCKNVALILDTAEQMKLDILNAPIAAGVEA